MPYEFAGLTDVGRRREHNEDALVVSPELGLIVLADGMGGHAAGEVASNLAVGEFERFYSSLQNAPETTEPQDVRYDKVTNELRAGMQKANALIRSEALEADKQGMGTTCVAARLEPGKAVVAWVGDSRAYRFRYSELIQFTEDHSLLNELLREGRLSPADAPNFIHRNVITRALGISPRVETDTVQVPLAPGDTLLLCSDGLNTMLEDEQIASILSMEPDLTQACQTLIDAANAAGGHDNITVALARWTE